MNYGWDEKLVPIFGWSSIMLKRHLKCDIARWDGEPPPAPAPTSLQRCATPQTDSEGGRVISSMQLSRRDMRHTARVTDKQPWSSGASSREKHCLGVDNKLLPQRGYCSTSNAASRRDLNSLKSLKGLNSPSAADTWLSQVCLINFGNLWLWLFPDF